VGLAVLSAGGSATAAADSASAAQSALDSISDGKGWTNSYYFEQGATLFGYGQPIEDLVNAQMQLNPNFEPSDLYGRVYFYSENHTELNLLTGNLRGDQGLQGLQGDQGDKGDKGDQGDKGDKGNGWTSSI